MNRRGFLGLLGGALAAGALKEVIPFNRVWSFPSKIVVAQPIEMKVLRSLDISMTSEELVLSIDDFSERYLQPAMAHLFNTIDLSLYQEAA